MRTFVAVALTGVVSAHHVYGENEFKFIQFLSKFSKSYSTVEEFNERAFLFKKHDAEIEQLNATQTTSVHGHNFLSDWTAAEKTRLLGLANI